jgi:hypothetical protein
MAIKKTYTSDLSGEPIEDSPVTLTLQRSVQKRGSWGGRYTQNETKKLHLTKDESKSLFNSEIRQWLGFEKPAVPEKKPAKRQASK